MRNCLQHRTAPVSTGAEAFIGRLDAALTTSSGGRIEAIIGAVVTFTSLRSVRAQQLDCAHLNGRIAVMPQSNQTSALLDPICPGLRPESSPVDRLVARTIAPCSWRTETPRAAMVGQQAARTDLIMRPSGTADSGRWSGSALGRDG
jgi:hypothetical protein